MVYSCNGVLYSSEEETRKNKDESQEQCKQDAKECIQHDSIYLKFKNKIKLN